MGRLGKQDIMNCVRRLDPNLRDLMMGSLAGVTVVAGGFVRSVVSGEAVNDIDIFVTSQIEINVMTTHFQKVKFAVLSSPNADTFVRDGSVTLQVIKRWMFGNSNKVVELRNKGGSDTGIAALLMLQEAISSFDFTVCQAGITYVKDEGWIGFCSDEFYPDLCSKRLVYTKPERMEDAGGSMLRLLKFTARGYKATLESVAAIGARWVMGRNDILVQKDGRVEVITVEGDPTDPGTPIQAYHEPTERELSLMLEERLVEVDPSPTITVNIHDYIDFS